MSPDPSVPNGMPIGSSRLNTIELCNVTSTAWRPEGRSNVTARVCGSPIALVNEELMQERWAPGHPAAPDGLTTLKFEVITRASLPDAAPDRSASWELVKVRLAGRPSAKQTEALAASAAPPGYRRP